MQRPARDAPRALISPFTNTTNAYIELQKQLLRDIGYDVRPLSMRYLLRGGFVDLFRPPNLIVLQWIELRAFVDNRRRVVPRLRGLPAVLLYCVLMALSRAKVVCVVHDHAVHNTLGAVRTLSIALMALVRRLADVRVVHDEHYVARYDACYLPHPLYWDVPGRTMLAGRDGLRAPMFSFLGTIEPYKGIAEVLSTWPEGHALTIAGRGQAAYIAALRDIVQKRELATCVTLDARFLSDAQFDAQLDATDVLILPHVAGSMLVSGAFFEAIGRVPVVIGRAIPFMRDMAVRFDNVLLFEREDELPEIVRYVTANWARFAAPEAIAAKRQQAIRTFGWEVCRQRYAQCFEASISAEEVCRRRGMALRLLFVIRFSGARKRQNPGPP